MRHFGSILAWALISATVGVILNAIRVRGGFVGKLAAAFIGGVWDLVTFFVVPVLILEDKGVIDAFGESVSLIRKTWGESIVGSASIGIIFIGIGIVAFLVVLAAMLTGSLMVFLAALVLFLLLIAVLAVVGSAMQGIFVTALYMYAKTGQAPPAFSEDLIRNAFVPKQAGPGNI